MADIKAILAKHGKSSLDEAAKFTPDQHPAEHHARQWKKHKAIAIAYRNVGEHKDFIKHLDHAEYHAAQHYLKTGKDPK